MAGATGLIPIAAREENPYPGGNMLAPGPVRADEAPAVQQATSFAQVRKATPVFHEGADSA